MWKSLVNNWAMKLTALALAVVVWLWANSEVTRTTQIEAYFEVAYPGSVDVQVEPENRRVMLTVKGPTAVFDDISRRVVQVIYKMPDVAGASEDRREKVAFDPKMVLNLPAQVQVVGFSPESFTVRVRRIETKSLPVNPPRIEGKPTPGYEVSTPEILGSPWVSVTGPASVLQRMIDEHKGVDPEPIDVTHRTEPIRDRRLRIQTLVRLDNATTEQIHCDETVDAFVDIRRAVVPGVVKGVPVAVLTAPGVTADVEITSGNPIDLAVEGGPEALKTLAAEKLRAFIDVRSRRPDTDVPFFEKLLVDGLPEGVHLAKEVVVTAKFKLPARPAEKAAP